MRLDRLARGALMLLAAATTATLLFTLMLPPAFLTDDTRALIRALARAVGCSTPSIDAKWAAGNTGQMEVTVTCHMLGED